jgi:transcriptional regulator of aroF, aroG, tyrA and aromatic amino acid transport
MPEPFLSLDLKSKVERVNQASCQLFAQSQDAHSPSCDAVDPGFNFQRWLESNPQGTHSEHVVINGQNFLMEITPVHLKGEMKPEC